MYASIRTYQPELRRKPLAGGYCFPELADQFLPVFRKDELQEVPRNDFDRVQTVPPDLRADVRDRSFGGHGVEQIVGAFHKPAVLLLAPAELLLDPLAVGDVRATDREGAEATLSLDQGGANGDVHEVSSGVLVLDLALIRYARPRHAVEAGPHHRPVFRHGQIVDARTEDLLAREVHGVAVQEEDHAVAIQDHDQIARALGERSPSRLGRSQGPAGTSAFG